MYFIPVPVDDGLALQTFPIKLVRVIYSVSLYALANWVYKFKKDYSACWSNEGLPILNSYSAAGPVLF